MRKICIYFVAALLCCSLFSASAQLVLTSGVDPNAAQNGDYAADLFWNFSNSGGSGSYTSGIGNNLYGANSQNWSQGSVAISFTYSPVDPFSPGFADVVATVGVSSIETLISAPVAAPTELEILIGNTGTGGLVLTLTSINSVAYGGTLNAFGPYVYGGTPPTFTAGSALSAANGTTLQAYLNDPTIFSSAFTLNGTITLDALANSTDYGDNLNSIVEFNLTSTPEPSTWALMAGGAGLLSFLRRGHRRVGSFSPE